MEGPTIFSGVKPVMWITSAEDQALLLVGKTAIICRLFDEDKGEPAVLEVDESDENLEAIGGEDQQPGSHWSNMMEIQNGRRVAVSSTRNKNIQLITLQTIAEDRRREVERLIDDQLEIVRGIDSMERVVEALENRNKVVVKRSDEPDNIGTGTTPAVTSAVDNKLKSKTGTASVGGHTGSTATTQYAASKLEEPVNGDHFKKPPAFQRLISPELAKKTRLKNLAEAGIKHKQHPVSAASSEIYETKDYTGGKAKGVVNKINTPIHINVKSHAHTISEGDKTRPKVLIGRRSPILFKPSQKGEAGGKEMSKPEMMQSGAKKETGSAEHGDKQGSTRVILKKTGVEGINKPGAKTSAGKYPLATSISASPVRDSLHPGASDGKTVTNTTTRLAWQESPRSAKL